MPRAALYCRLSEEDRDKLTETAESRSIQNQKALLVQYATERGWEIHGIYSDEDYAGADRCRPEFQKLLKDAGEHQFDIILCKSQSRFTRELELVEKYIHTLFPLWHIRFVSIVDNADTDNKGNKKSRQINGLVNEWYLEDMSESIKSVLNNKRENGLHIGASALYGYRKDPDHRGHLLVDDEAAEIVRYIFKLYEQGYGKTAIARLLNTGEIPNPAEYKRRHSGGREQGEKKGGRKNSTLWSYSTVSRILANEIYIGNMVQGKYGSESYKSKKNRPRKKEEWFVVQGTHDAIISAKSWEEVQKTIGDRSRPYADGKPGLFSGKAKCIYCGYALRTSRSHGKTYLQCPVRHFAKTVCKGAFIGTESLEAAVSAELCRMSETYLDSGRLAEQTPQTGWEKKREIQKKKLEGLGQKLADCARGQKMLYGDRLKGIVSEEEYISYKKELEEEKEKYSELYAKAETDLRFLEERPEKGKVWESVVHKLAFPGELKREVLEELVECIYVGRREEECGELEIHLMWKF